MRSLTLLFVMLAAALAGCGGYDRELLGDPEPVAVEPAEPEASFSESGTTYPDSLGYEEIVHTPADYEMFGDLGPYGDWYETDMYGVVWRPIVPADWRPYERGHWMWTSYGWMWASYDPFGWATFHYGTWWWDLWLGWVWIPGYAWAPCPVSWVVVDDYYGWAPLPPPGCSWDDPWIDDGKYKNGWVVVEAGKFKEVDVGENNIPPSRFKERYRAGSAERRAPETGEIERVTRQSVKETNIKFDSKRYGDHELRKVILPSQEQQIVERFPLPSSPATQTQTQLTPTGSSGGDNGGSTPTTSKTKAKNSTPPAKKEPATAKGKIKGDSKDSGKSKGDSPKDDGKSKDGGSKDDEKDDGGTSKAKGKNR